MRQRMLDVPQHLFSPSFLVNHANLIQESNTLSLKTEFPTTLQPDVANEI